MKTIIPYCRRNCLLDKRRNGMRLAVAAMMRARCCLRFLETSLSQGLKTRRGPEWRSFVGDPSIRFLFVRFSPTYYYFLLT